MVFGIGTDILRIDRLRKDKASLQENSSFMRKVFTQRERDQARDSLDPVLDLATRFAGKEAVFKALGTCDCGIRLNEIEIMRFGIEPPVVSLSGRMQELAEAGQVIDVQISLTHDSQYAIAFALMQRQEQNTRPANYSSHFRQEFLDRKNRNPALKK